MTHKELLKTFLNIFTGQSKVLIVINADPDAIASAMAVKRILWRKVSEVTIAYFNKISRPDNLAMINLTDSDLTPFSEINNEDFDKFLIVDSQPDHNDCFERFKYDAIIDHHPVTPCDAGFLDIRPEYGACSTIMTQYLKAAKIKPSGKLAAALMLGIKTDTSDFTRQAGIKDLKAFQYLYQLADINIIIKVQRAIVTIDDLDLLALAIKKRMIIHNRIFFHAGNISKPDELVVIADFFLSVAKINWSIISGIYDKKLIVIVRNDGLRKGAGKTVQEAFSQYGSAGGHKAMARAELDLKLIKKETRGVSKRVLEAWIIKKIETTAGKKIE